QGEARSDLARRSRMGQEAFDCALDKLWIHGGVVISGDMVAKGAGSWLPGYEAQRAHRVTQEEQMAAFAAGRGCRMVRIVRHFGDEEDAKMACGQCDVCDTAACVVQKVRLPSAEEQVLLKRILAEVAHRPRLAVGTLYRDAFAALDRDTFEALVA